MWLAALDVWQAAGLCGVCAGITFATAHRSQSLIHAANCFQPGGLCWTCVTDSEKGPTSNAPKGWLLVTLLATSMLIPHYIPTSRMQPSHTTSKRDFVKFLPEGGSVWLHPSQPSAAEQLSLSVRRDTSTKRTHRDPFQPGQTPSAFSTWQLPYETQSSSSMGA